MNKTLKQEFLKKYDEVLNFFEGSDEDLNSLNIWDTLLEFEEFSLIKKVFRASIGAPGFGTLVVPDGGFCPYPRVNEAVVRWLEFKGVNVLDVKKEILEIEESLR